MPVNGAEPDALSLQRQALPEREDGHRPVDDARFALKNLGEPAAHILAEALRPLVSPASWEPISI